MDNHRLFDPFLFKETPMKRVLSLAALVLLAGFAFAADTMPASDNPYANDFTTGMGNWKLNKSEGKQDATGLKITKTDEYGGIIIDDNKKADLSAYKTVTVDFVNGDTRDVQIIMKIGSGQSDKRTENEVTLPPGEKSLSWKIAGAPVDVSGVNYLNFWITEAGAHNITIKKISFPTASPAATGPAKQNP
jgi:hypothetical protein